MAKEGNIIDYDIKHGVNVKDEKAILSGRVADESGLLAMSIMNSRYEREQQSYQVTEGVLNDLEKNLGVKTEGDFKEKVSLAAQGRFEEAKLEWRTGQDFDENILNLIGTYYSGEVNAYNQNGKKIILDNAMLPITLFNPIPTDIEGLALAVLVPGLKGTSKVIKSLCPKLFNTEGKVVDELYNLEKGITNTGVVDDLLKLMGINNELKATKTLANVRGSEVHALNANELNGLNIPNLKGDVWVSKEGKILKIGSEGGSLTIPKGTEEYKKADVLYYTDGSKITVGDSLKQKVAEGKVIMYDYKYGLTDWKGKQKNWWDFNMNFNPNKNNVKIFKLPWSN